MTGSHSAPTKTDQCAGALAKCLWEETHVLKVVGLNPGTV